MEGNLSGTYILVAGGTGVLPYLDFCFYVIRYIVDRISRTKFKEKYNKIDDTETFVDLEEDFKLILFVSYSSSKSSCMHEILTAASNLDKKYNLKKFEYHMRTGKEKRFESAYFEDKMRFVSKLNNKVYLCGPVAFMNAVKEELLVTGKISAEDITYT